MTFYPTAFGLGFQSLYSIGEPLKWAGFLGPRSEVQRKRRFYIDSDFSSSVVWRRPTEAQRTTSFLHPQRLFIISRSAAAHGGTTKTSVLHRQRLFIISRLAAAHGGTTKKNRFYIDSDFSSSVVSRRPTEVQRNIFSAFFPNSLRLGVPISLQHRGTLDELVASGKIKVLNGHGKTAWPLSSGCRIYTI